MKLLPDFASILTFLSTGAMVTVQKLKDREGVMGELRLKLQLQWNGSGRFADLQRFSHGNIGVIESAKKSLRSWRAAFKEKDQKNGLAEVEPWAGWAAFSRSQRVVHGFAENCIHRVYLVNDRTGVKSSRSS